MTKNISILGCGWLGLLFAKELLKKGYKVNGSCTSTAKLDTLKQNNINAFVINTEDINDNIEPFLDSEVLLIAITSKNIEAYRSLIKHIEKSNIKKVIFISSTSVYTASNSIVDEETPTNDGPLAEIEKLFINNPIFKTTIIRFAGLIGYTRKPGNFIRPDSIIRNPKGYVNMIHRDDCLAILHLIITKNVFGQVLNACADEHPTRGEYYIQEMKKVGRENHKLEEESTAPYKIISNQKLKNILNYSFKYAKLLS
ncbi:NAD(P)H-binding protein [Saccharicrinis aurantiacus]|uniref:NAD(P)H-binding protein n=1 Tax=Saccharicrinis aurantiacus TaxID=1849719 RepID=UPI00248F6B74|nr:NAD(P)H-binding protein [Saccharicrinis aurantiacus]